MRLSDRILVIGNGGIKKTQRYEEDDEIQFIDKLDNFFIPLDYWQNFLTLDDAATGIIEKTIILHPKSAS